MTRLNALDPGSAPAPVKELFDAIHSKLGVVPNMMRTMGNSKALLEGYLNFNDSLSSGLIGGKLAELIAITVAEANQCQYCASAHAYIGKNMAGLSEDDISAARTLSHIDGKTDAALRFAHEMVQKRGRLADEDLAFVRNAGFTDSEIAEIIGHVALNTLTNYFNNIANTEIDFPKVELTSVAAL